MNYTIPSKEEPLCSNAYLIDKRSCLKNSLSVINFNTNQLHLGLSALDVYAQQWNNLFTIFTVNSASWYDSFTNVQTFSASWNDTYNTINSLSSHWCKEITLYYPYSQEIYSWYSLSSASQNTTINTWLNYTFPANGFSLGQPISVNVNLYETTPFSFNFARSLYDPCTPSGGGSVSCGECALPFRTCNHHGGQAGYGPCTNSYAGCRRATSNSGPSSFACPGYGAKNLQIGMSQNYTDTHSARIIRLKFRNVSNNWIPS